jgi:PIN domain nuclease of toxin-antitoxin system
VILFDTSAWIWSMTTDPRLGPEAIETIENGSIAMFVSSVSVFEIETKRRSGKLVAPFELLEVARRNHYDLLALDGAEAELAGRLEWEHRDPFDRLLVAQARLNGFKLMTSDRVILEYESIAMDARR